MAPAGRRGVAALLLGLLPGHVVAAGALSDLGSEEAAVSALEDKSFSFASIEAADVERLVHRGWHDVVRTLVLKGHAGGEADSVRVVAQVRQAVQQERNKLDDLIRVLDRNYGKASEVTPASQWAQNSTHVFVAIKFAQRWNAPGALEVENETVSITSSSMIFTAFGEHSFIRRRYYLAFDVFADLKSEASSWSLASVGRMSVTLVKKQAANWPRLLRNADAAPKNLGVWLDMKDKWQAELAKLKPAADAGAASSSASSKAKEAPKKGKKEKKKARRAQEDDEDDDADDALDREVELVSDCAKSSFVMSSVAELCAKAWTEVVTEPRVKGRTWLVELYSSQGDGDLAVMRTLTPLWKRLAEVFPTFAPTGRVGSLDCGLDKELCRRLGASTAKLPQVYRFGAGSNGELWKGSLEASIEEFAEWGSGKTEL